MRVHLLILAAAACTLAPLQAQRGSGYGGSIFLRSPGSGNLGGGFPFGGFGFGVGSGVSGGRGFGYGAAYGAQGYAPYRYNSGYGYGYTGSSGYGLNGAYGYSNGYGYGGYLLYPRLGLLNGNPGVPTGPSFANPGPVAAPEPTAAAIIAPSTPGGADWAEIRTRFASVSSKLQSARTSVAEMKARLASMGQAPRAELTSRLAMAETAMGDASKAMEARSLDEAQTALQRADYVIGQVLKEFDR